MGHGRGRHRKPKTSNLKRNVALGAAMSVGGVVIPSTFAGTANAATIDDWNRVAKCESGGLWNRMDGDRDSTGGLQFRVASWGDALSYLRTQGVDTSAYPSIAGQATKEQQVMAGEALLALQGPRAWSVTFNGGAHCGNAAGGALGSGSMFKGGPKPFDAPPPPTNTPPPVIPPPARQSQVDAPNSKPHAHHTVKRGDTLYGIAKAHTGNSDKHNWVPLWNRNKKVIGSNPNLIYPGQVLSMPDGSGGNTAPASPPPSPQPKSTPLSAPPTPSSSGYKLPVQGRIGDSLIIGSSGSMSRSAGGHSGLDITAPAGTPVVSAAAGTVVGIGGAGWAYGNHVIVKHAEGVYTLYAHLAGDIVSLGQRLTAGQQLGYVGSSGNSSGPHLHFEVRSHPTSFSSSIFSNPVTWLRSHGVTV